MSMQKRIDSSMAFELELVRDDEEATAEIDLPASQSCFPTWLPDRHPSSVPPSGSPPSSGVMTRPLAVAWFDPERAGAVRDQPDWWHLVAEHKLAPTALDDPPWHELARLVFRDVLTAGRPATDQQLRQHVHNALCPNGLEPPMVLVEGNFELLFDELDTLRATMMVMTPLSRVDKSLLGPLETVAAFLSKSMFQHAAPTADRLTMNLLGAFQPERHGLTHAQLKLIVGRTLIEQRSYQCRSIHGRDWIRAGFTRQGGETLFAHLPAELDQFLPLLPNMQLRLIAAVEAEQFPDHASPSLRSVAVAPMPSLPT